MTAVATATARPRMCPGKISLITVQTTGPIEKAKQMMKPTRAKSVTMPAPLGACRGGADSVRPDKPEGDADRGQADRHADQPGEQQFAPSQTVDKGDGDQGGEHVDAADRPGGHRRLR